MCFSWRIAFLDPLSRHLWSWLLALKYYSKFRINKCWCASCATASLCRMRPLMKYNATANCSRNGNNVCSIVFQIWRSTGTGYFTLVNSASFGHNPDANNLKQEMLSFTLDMEFTVSDMVGFYHDQPDPLNVCTALAGSCSYLQWST